MYRYTNIFIFLLLAGLSSCLTSEKNHKARIYLQGVDSISNRGFEIPEPVIKKGDLLTILIFSDNETATEIYNQPQAGGNAGGAGAGNASNMSTMGKGYQVDVSGNIYIHSLGMYKAEGLTRSQLSQTLKDSLITYLKNPYVIVRFANNRLTILGEVLKPGYFDLPDQKISILDALGLAGDLTPFGRRDNILVVREIDGRRTMGRLDIRKPDIYNSPYFYLQQNDMVYVEPTRRKPTGNEQVLLRNVAIATSLLSVVTLLVTLITR
ncbi:polysaccharide biosynthesis/export family protein [Flavihumibacter solisilvae]|uniref:polysaccharide biosynthesis/export family protein n=1 Tax=Flavihumibacter solisilvae TaxID=1349421 RepID=UPI00068C604C|nr:polysaccharide biosynthesis/export family protein [Flavihumibacter solisilvae]